jgi:hypothetical protein
MEAALRGGVEEALTMRGFDTQRIELPGVGCRTNACEIQAVGYAMDNMKPGVDFQDILPAMLRGSLGSEFDPGRIQPCGEPAGTRAPDFSRDDAAKEELKRKLNGARHSGIPVHCQRTRRAPNASEVSSMRGGVGRRRDLGGVSTELCAKPPADFLAVRYEHRLRWAMSKDWRRERDSNSGKR